MESYTGSLPSRRTRVALSRFPTPPAPSTVNSRILREDEIAQAVEDWSVTIDFDPRENGGAIANKHGRAPTVEFFRDGAGPFGTLYRSEARCW